MLHTLCYEHMLPVFTAYNEHFNKGLLTYTLHVHVHAISHGSLLLDDMKLIGLDMEILICRFWSPCFLFYVCILLSDLFRVHHYWTFSL